MNALPISSTLLCGNFVRPFGRLAGWSRSRMRRRNRLQQGAASPFLRLENQVLTPFV
jgi:hypothetical protein